MLVQVILFFLLMYIGGTLLGWYTKRRKIRKEKKLLANMERMLELEKAILAEEKKLAKQARKVAKEEKRAAKELRKNRAEIEHWAEDPNRYLTDGYNKRLN